MKTPVGIKTPVGSVHVAFKREEDAREYLSATGLDAHFSAVAVPLAELLQRDPAALGALTALLVFPSRRVVRRFRRDPSAFPYERYVVNAASAGGSRGF